MTSAPEPVGQSAEGAASSGLTYLVESVVRRFRIRTRIFLVAAVNIAVIVVLAILLWISSKLLNDTWTELQAVRSSERLVATIESEASRERWRKRLANRAVTTMEDAIDRGTILCGSPETVVAQIKRIHGALGNGVFNLTVKVGTIPDPVIRRGMELFRDRVLPHVRHL